MFLHQEVVIRKQMQDGAQNPPWLGDQVEADVTWDMLKAMDTILLCECVCAPLQPSSAWKGMTGLDLPLQTHVSLQKGIWPTTLRLEDWWKPYVYCLHTQTITTYIDK